MKNMVLNIDLEQEHKLQEMCSINPDTESNQIIQALLDDLRLISGVLASFITGSNLRRELEGIEPLSLRYLLEQAKEQTKGYETHVLDLREIKNEKDGIR
jgi:hypothetical protein